MNKGAVWQTPRRKTKPRRIRRTATTLQHADRLAIYDNEKLLALKPPPLSCLADLVRYNVFKMYKARDNLPRTAPGKA